VDTEWDHTDIDPRTGAVFNLPKIWWGESSRECLDNGLNCSVVPSDDGYRCVDCGALYSR